MKTLSDIQSKIMGLSIYEDGTWSVMLCDESVVSSHELEPLNDVKIELRALAESGIHVIDKQGIITGKLRLLGMTEI